MSVIVYVESENGAIKKGSFEVASYGRAIADACESNLIAVTFNQEDGNALGHYGVDKIINVSSPELETFVADHYSETLAKIIADESATVVVTSATANGRYLAPMLAVKADASYLSNVVSIPSSYTPLTVKRSCFTNKAFNTSKSNKACTVISLSPNAYGVHEKTTTPTQENTAAVMGKSKLSVSSIEKTSNTVSIADADIVVSGGRGLKGPENWHLIEDLADVLGAATACSKPVSDMGWRPHSEHVGQTGKPVASNLYIAVGVSGAIQHLAGINSSKVKVVINNDPEAPFFKAADYGIVGDAFEVLPKLIDKLKVIKQ